MDEIVQRGNIVKKRRVRALEEPVKPIDLTKYKMPLFERMRLTPKMDSELEAMASDLVTWAQDEDAVVFDEFVAISGVPTPRLYEWARKNETLAEAMAIAKRLIGARRERRGLEGKYNPGLVMGMMWNYNDEYKAWKRELKEKAPEVSSGDFTVIMETMPNSPLVEEKK